MKITYVQTTLHGEEDLINIVKTRLIGIGAEPIRSQPIKFKDIPLTFCSFISEGYTEVYGNRKGVAFETESPIIYTCPVDTFDLMRGGNWLPGHEQFIFSSIDKMLEKYPSSEHFKKDFQNYFKSLKPKQVYPNNSEDFADVHYHTDYCLDFSTPWRLGCNEVTFQKPLKIKNVRIFHSREELDLLIK